MALINQAKLNQYARNGYNVLFDGKHGVGKTEIIKATFNDLGWNWRYFSASTLDPWVDLIGIPKSKTNDKGEEQLMLVRPDFILADNVQALFFDELNRAPDKVLNAVMELIQFKSINGYKLHNLKVIWAAINPWDEANTYAVNDLDPALIDRFQVKISVPYKVDEDYFFSKYPETGQIFTTWWNAMDAELRNDVSPRRLDYAADAHSKNLEMTDILPVKSNVKKLREQLSAVPFLKIVQNLKTEAQIKAFLSKINNVTELTDMAKNQNPMALKFLTDHRKHLPKEVLEALAAPIAKSKGKAAKLNHGLCEEAFEILLRDSFADPMYTFNVAATNTFQRDKVFAIELLADPKFAYYDIVLNELKLYKDGSRAAHDRVVALTTATMDYMTKAPPMALDQLDILVIAMMAAVIEVDGGSVFTLPRREFLAKRLLGYKSTYGDALAAKLKGPV